MPGAKSTPFFVRKSRSPISSKTKASRTSPQAMDLEQKEAFIQYEKIMDLMRSSPPRSPSPLEESYKSSPKSSSEDGQPSEEELVGSDLLVDEDASSSQQVIVSTDDIDFGSSDDLCDHSDIIKVKGITVCRLCGAELYEDISHEQDWRYFGDSDSRNSSDPSRCQYRKSPEKGIKKDLERLGFPPDICEKADDLYMMVTRGEIKRSELRRGIMFSTVFEAYRMKGKPQTPDDLQKKFGLDRKSMSQGITFYRMRCPRENFEYEDISAKHFIPQIMKKLNIKQEHIDKVILLHERIKDVCPVLNRSNPQSTSKSLVYYYLRRKGCSISPVRYARIVQLSEVIILRLSNEISKALGTQNSLSLT